MNAFAATRVYKTAMLPFAKLVVDMYYNYFSKHYYPLLLFNWPIFCVQWVQ